MLSFNVDDNLKDYQEFISNVNQVDIYQDSRWISAAVKKDYGKYHIFTLRENEQIIVGAVAYIKDIRHLGKYIYIQHGPQFKLETNTDAFSTWGNIDLEANHRYEDCIEFLNRLAQYAKSNDYISVVFEPLAASYSQFAKILLHLGYQNYHHFNLPKYPMYLDLAKKEETLLAEVTKNTRYNIKYAEKKGVTIEVIYPTHDNTHIIEEFYSILNFKSEVKNFRIPAKSFFIDIWNNFAGTNNVAVIFAKYNNEYISANFTLFYSDWAGSHYTANLLKHKNLKASYLLKWATIIHSQKRGIKLFDMWGDIPNVKHNHPEYGVIVFKKGFNPITRNFCGWMILPLNLPKYTLWLHYNYFKKTLRGLRQVR